MKLSKPSKNTDVPMKYMKVLIHWTLLRKQADSVPPPKCFSSCSVGHVDRKFVSP